MMVTTLDGVILMIWGIVIIRFGVEYLCTKLERWIEGEK